MAHELVLSDNVKVRRILKNDRYVRTFDRDEREKFASLPIFLDENLARM